MYYEQSDETKLKWRRTKEAIALTMQNRWEEAVATNMSIIESFPDDVDAYNRLGKALMELGRYNQAREAYNQALNLAPNNIIAKKNLSRLSNLREEQLSSSSGRCGATPGLFIEEAGKAGVVNLYHLGPDDILASLVAGDQVHLEVKGQKLIVMNSQGEYVGQVDPKRGQRLVRLIESGNRYAGAVARLRKGEVQIIIREVFQHPSQTGSISFPLKEANGFRSYVKESMIKYDLESEEEAIDEDIYPTRLEREELLPEDVSVYEEAAPLENQKDAIEAE